MNAMLVNEWYSSLRLRNDELYSNILLGINETSGTGHSIISSTYPFPSVVGCTASCRLLLPTSICVTARRAPMALQDNLNDRRKGHDTSNKCTDILSAMECRMEVVGLPSRVE